MNLIKPAVFSLAFCTLMLEVLLMRVFDVILFDNISYMIISCALFSFGLAGVYATLKPFKKEIKVNYLLSQPGIPFWNFFYYTITGYECSSF